MNALTEGDHLRNIRDGCIRSTMRPLVVAPHPDDFDVTLKFLSSTSLQTTLSKTVLRH